MEQNDVRHRLVVRTFTPESDYVMIQKWWEEHHSYAPDLDHLGKNGRIIECDGLPVCAGFLYNTDSSICIFEFVISDPAKDKDTRDICLDRLIQVAKDWAKENKYKLLYSPANKIKFINRLESFGFIEIDNNMSHMFYKIEG